MLGSIMQRLPELMAHNVLYLDKLHARGHINCDLTLDLFTYEEMSLARPPEERLAKLTQALWGKKPGQSAKESAAPMGNTQVAEQFHK